MPPKNHHRYTDLFINGSWYTYEKIPITIDCTPKITKVIFNPPATIVFWSDHTKTVVKCGEDEPLFDKEKGIAMAIAKKFGGNIGHYYTEMFQKWVTDEKYKELDIRKHHHVLLAENVANAKAMRNNAVGRILNGDKYITVNACELLALLNDLFADEAQE